MKSLPIERMCFLWIVLLANITFLTSTSTSQYRFPYTESLKVNFERTFYDQCAKYPFVKKYQDLLENPNGRYFMFVAQEPNLKNGGWGDRLSGLITSVELALRFNRTLLIRSHSYLYLYFRPFHPIDIHQPTPKYTWQNWLEWSGYQMEWANHDSTEYDLYDCINSSGIKNDHCSMEEGDAPTPTILYRSNRCYLCRIDNGGHGHGQADLRSKLGVKQGEDLFEVAGCMLRLAIWPTENMWQLVDNYYADATKQFGFFHPSDAKKKQDRRQRYLRQKHNTTVSSRSDIRRDRSQWEQQLQEILENPWAAVSHFFSPPKQRRSLTSQKDDAFQMDTNIAIYGADSKYLHPTGTLSSPTPAPTPTPLKVHSSDKTDKGDTFHMETNIAIYGADPKYLHPAVTLSSSSPKPASTPTPTKMPTSDKTDKDKTTIPDRSNDHPSSRKPDKPSHHNGNHKDLTFEPFLQLAAHFRCGDWSYAKGGDVTACVFTNSELNAASFYMQHGNPVQLAQCLQSSFHNHTLELIHSHRRILTPTRLLQLSEHAKAKGEALTIDTLSNEGQFLLIYITSDSAFSSEQMRSVLQYNHTVLAPSGCHIEHDTSLQCLELTVVQWFVLSLSSHIAVQTEQGGTPVSAFSRYAGVYRLQSSSPGVSRSDPVLLDGQHCAESPSHKAVSKLHQGNWFC